MKNGQIGWKFGEKNMNFPPKVSIFEFFLANWRYFASTRNTDIGVSEVC
jgi:hypothetical protein